MTSATVALRADGIGLIGIDLDLLHEFRCAHLQELRLNRALIAPFLGEGDLSTSDWILMLVGVYDGLQHGASVCLLHDVGQNGCSNQSVKSANKHSVGLLRAALIRTTIVGIVREIDSVRHDPWNDLHLTEASLAFTGLHCEVELGGRCHTRLTAISEEEVDGGLALVDDIHIASSLSSAMSGDAVSGVADRRHVFVGPFDTARSIEAERINQNLLGDVPRHASNEDFSRELGVDIAASRQISGPYSARAVLIHVATVQIGR